MNKIGKKSFDSSWSGFLKKAKLNCENEKTIETEGNKMDYNFLTVIGQGSFSEIYKVEYKKDRKLYAIKMITTEFQKRGYYEKHLLSCIKFEFITYLINFFQDDKYLYIVLPLAEAGDLFTLLRKFHKFNENLSQFYAAQVLLGLEYLHNINIIYRDMKPENILLDKSGYIKLTDFGLSKITDGRTYTLCGTADYIAPEMLQSKGYGISVDFWAYGVLIYELNAGKSPFFAFKEEDMFEKICYGKYVEEPYFSYDLKDIIKNLLQTDITKRYGVIAEGVNRIRKHNWFMNMSWLPLLNKAIKPPYVPRIE